MEQHLWQAVLIQAYYDGQKRPKWWAKWIKSEDCKLICNMAGWPWETIDAEINRRLHMRRKDNFNGTMGERGER